MNDFMNVRLETLVLFVPAKSFSMKIYQAEKLISCRSELVFRLLNSVIFLPVVSCRLHCRMEKNIYIKEQAGK